MKRITSWLSNGVLSNVGQVCGGHCEVMRAREHSGVAKLDASKRRPEPFSGKNAHAGMRVAESRLGGKIKVHVGHGAYGWWRE